MRKGGPEQRREIRLPVRLPAELRIYRGRYEVALTDLSNGGAMVSGEGAMPGPGDEVMLAFAGQEIVATVTWTAGANAGLTFHRAIDAAAVIRTLHEAGRARLEDGPGDGAGPGGG